MMRAFAIWASACVFIAAFGLVATYTMHTVQAAVVPSSGSGVRFLYQNDLDWNRANSAKRQTGYLLLTSALTASEASSRCRTLGETLAPASAASDPGLQAQFSYAVLDGTYKATQPCWLADGNAVTATNGASGFTVTKPNANNKYPALCTQSAPWNTANSTDTSSKWRVITQSNGVQYTGYRDALSFRFNAVPYANPTQRFAYSTVFDAKTAGATTVAALDPSRDLQCPQGGSDSKYTEQCLVTNVFTPYLPSSSETADSTNLKPVFVWIHGGGYASGSGLDFTFDGGNLASRSDMVVLTINYRLGSLGFLAYNDQIKGNYGVGDVVTALKWVQKYIKDFGGDPKRVTIGGQSAGAQQVQNMLTSPAAANLFHRAIVFSGKGHDNAFIYPTVDQARQNGGADVVKSLNCDTASDTLACLRSRSVSDLLKYTYKSVVQDGTYIRSPRLDMRRPDQAQGHVNRVPVIWGQLRDELASLGTVPPASETDLANAMRTAGIASNYSDIVLRETNTFPVDQYGVQNLTVSVNTDIRYRCGIQAMAYASAVNSVFPSVYAYSYDQRSYQIPNYDPNNVCKAPAGNLDASSYYMCHSGDLMTIFGTTGTAFRLPYRDSNDLPWMAAIMDQFSAFIRTGNPAPSAAYLRARGQAYASSLARTTSGDTAWSQLTPSNLQSLSFGPVQQRMQPVAQRGDQCAAIGKGIDYIAKL
ncbi:related to Para-nitrobenzyl esterase [Sporisorium reilianum f. sp. reilianum]|uniref:Related to Para-nitrobenzyl esterase n=1 Tax=Sporisorium reilianum f. sp. reilianum TaxID=72559 RepID=A0A2N8U597_9BASI|nr:related to Para-nitrobenzyl esterase [Sporisorium reilianum f. sp. reilianum]